MKNNCPILVTGSHRSGTTWVSNIMAVSPGIRLLDEPFFNLKSAFLKDIVPRHWFLRITEENGQEYYGKIRYLLGRSYYLRREVCFLFRSLGQAVKRPRSSLTALLGCAENMFFKSRPLMKCPVGIFSAEWLAAAFNMNVVVMIRHPLSFAGSLKDLGWNFNFRDYLDQPLLMRELPGLLKEKIKEYTRKSPDIVDQACLLWNSIYHVVARYKESHKDWVFVRHEDISVDPTHWFTHIFNKCGLRLTPEVEREILRSTGAHNPCLLRKGDVDRFSTRRNSERNLYGWKDRLTPEEVDRVRTSVQEVSRAFYSEEDWLQAYQ